MPSPGGKTVGGVKRAADITPPGKTLGGVKGRSPVHRGGEVRTEAAGSIPARPIEKKLGGVRTPPPPKIMPVGFRTCTCGGIVLEGNWEHARGCPHMVVRWKRLGWGFSTWDCPRRCDPVVMPSSLTHHWTCAFWEEEGKLLTPFDERAGGPVQ